VSEEVRVQITSDADLVAARAEGRRLAERLGFSRTDATLIATAISEIARNIVVHVGEGEIVMHPVVDDNRSGLVVIARDEGVGIGDVRAALDRGYASRGGLGLGLPGVRRLMDEFELQSERDKGTTVTLRKWRVRDELERLRERRARGTPPPADLNGR
jgi:anti-sigma regulatory factor (Ser/Thr protein kinase)